MPREASPPDAAFFLAAPHKKSPDTDSSHIFLKCYMPVWLLHFFRILFHTAFYTCFFFIFNTSFHVILSVFSHAVSTPHSLFLQAIDQAQACLHLAAATRGKYPASCCAASLMPRRLASGALTSPPDKDTSGPSHTENSDSLKEDFQSNQNQYQAAA